MLALEFRVARVRDDHRGSRNGHISVLPTECFLIRFHCRCPLSESSYRLLSSPVSLPFSATHFLGPLPRANSYVLQLRGLCFPGSALNSIWVPSHKAAARFGSRSHSPLGGPKKMGQEKGENSVMAYLNSITLVGFVGSDPEQRQAKGNGSKFTVLSRRTPLHLLQVSVLV